MKYILVLCLLGLTGCQTMQAIGHVVAGGLKGAADGVKNAPPPPHTYNCQSFQTGAFINTTCN